MRCSIVWSLLVCAACADAPAYEWTDAAPCPTLGAACEVTPGSAPAITEPVIVAPSDMMPPEVVSQVSHNNLDIAWHRGRLFFAFRTAPYHFASRDTMLYIVSTTDQVNWTFEASFALDTDLREPRFLEIGDKLYLYFAVLGSYVAAFEPQYAMVTEQTGPGAWSEPERILDDGFIPWRSKQLDGRPVLFGYVGGENIYQGTGDGMQVSWLTTEDGKAFAPAVPDHQVVLKGGSSETDAVVLDDGALIAISRNELGDDFGWGSKICRAEPGAMADWHCVADVRKYDSPLVFRHGDDVYLIGRRQVTETGAYDLERRDLPADQQETMYEAEYWQTPKRCALWKVDPVALSVSHVLDLPSSGDTCFAGLVDMGEGRYLVYDYTSPLDSDIDRSWMTGQFGPTQIHSLTLTIP